MDKGKVPLKSVIRASGDRYIPVTATLGILGGKLMMTRILETTPRQDGFRMPGEYESHKKCWMLWPERADNWRLHAGPAQKTFAEVAQAISRFEPVVMGVAQNQLETARHILTPGVEIFEI